MMSSTMLLDLTLSNLESHNQDRTNVALNLHEIGSSSGIIHG